MNDDDFRRLFLIDEELNQFGEYTRAWGPVDLEGNPVKHTKSEFPYSYDGFVLHRLGPNSEIDGCVYVDRLFEWDYDKASRLRAKHLTKKWSQASPREIQSFLREWHDDPRLMLIAVMEWCNVATGYPTWSLHFKSGGTL